MPNRKILAAAIAGNIAVIAACLLAEGWNVTGAASAARNTARFSVLFFLVGFAAPGLSRWIAGLPRPSDFLYGFVAAHFIHFGAVLALHVGFANQKSFLTLAQAIVVIAGVTITATVGLTARPRPESRIYSAVHTVAIYAVFLILAGDYSQHPVKPMRLMVIPVLASLMLRHVPLRRSSVLNAT